MNVIGLTGVAGAGKSTVAQYLVEAHGYTRLSFAAPLKKMLRTLDPVLVTQPEFYSPPSTFKLSLALDFFGSEQKLKESKYGDEYRRLLQVLGTDCIRSIDPEFWIKAAEKSLTDPNGKYVFDDVRFPNEADLIKKYGEYGLWNVVRPGYEAVNGHSSEAHAGKMGENLHVVNDSSEEALRAQLDMMLEFAFSGERGPFASI